MKFLALMVATTNAINLKDYYLQGKNLDELVQLYSDVGHKSSFVDNYESSFDDPKAEEKKAFNQISDDAKDAKKGLAEIYGDDKKEGKKGLV